MSSPVTNLPALQSALAAMPENDLLFDVDGVKINTGYHVTEVKLADITSVDCGSTTDAWQELIIQLMDGSLVTNNDYMSCKKFSKILAASNTTLDATSDAQLYFEYSPGNGAMQKLQVTAIHSDSTTTVISLNGQKAQCKPFTNSLHNAKNSLMSCCRRSAGQSSACC